MLSVTLGVARYNYNCISVSSSDIMHLVDSLIGIVSAMISEEELSSLLSIDIDHKPTNTGNQESNSHLL